MRVRVRVRVKGALLRLLCYSFCVMDAGLWVQGYACLVMGAGLRVYAGLRVLGYGCWVSLG